MRFTTSFIEFVRTNRYAPGSNGDRIFARIVQHREKNNLDARFGATDPWKASDQILQYECLKLGTVFEAICSFDACGGPNDIIETLKETYPAAEVDELILEYFPELGSPTSASDKKSAHP